MEREAGQGALLTGPALGRSGPVATLRDLTDDFVVIDFAGLANETLVLPRKDMVAATEEILTDNGVRAQGSADTMAIWNAKPAK